MAKHISQNMEKDGDMYRGKNFDLIEIDTAISADWLDEQYDYDGFVFLSKHAVRIWNSCPDMSQYWKFQWLNLAVMRIGYTIS